MCGINGMVFLNKVARNYEMMDAIRFLFDECLVETEDRGHHATGLAVFNRNGGEYAFWKDAVSASAMVASDETYNEIVDWLNQDTGVVVSHTRWYTKGKPDNNDNNHPFDIGNVVGVHNGTVSNDDELFKQYEDRFQRIAEVDSEIIYQLINHYNKDKITFSGLQDALEKSLLRGYFALAFVHKSQPNLLHIVKQDRPMDFFFWEEAGVIVFNSDKKYILNAFSRVKRIGKRFGIDVPVTLKEYKLPADRYVTIDANAESFEDAFSEPKKIYITSTVTNYTGTTTNRNATGVNFTRVSAQDSIGRIIEGELDTITGEIIIYTSAMSTVGEDDDGSGLLDQDEHNDNSDGDYVYCAECENPLAEHELHASYNEGAATNDTYYCSGCHRDALNRVFAG